MTASRAKIDKRYGGDLLGSEPATANLPSARSDLESVLADLAEIRGRVRGPVDAVAVVRGIREDL